MMGAARRPPRTLGRATFHAGDGDDDVGFAEGFEVGDEAVEAGDAGIVDGEGLVAHEVGGEAGFLGDGEVAGAGGDDGDARRARGVGEAVEIDGVGEFVVVEGGDEAAGGAELFLRARVARTRGWCAARRAMMVAAWGRRFCRHRRRLRENPCGGRDGG